MGAFEEEMIQGEGGMGVRMKGTVWEVDETNAKEVGGKSVMVES